MIHGLADPFLLPAALDGTWQWVDNQLTLLTVRGAGHWVHNDAADLVTATMRDWLARLSSNQLKTGNMRLSVNVCKL